MISYSVSMILIHIVYSALVFVLGVYVGKKSIKLAKTKR